MKKGVKYAIASSAITVCVAACIGIGVVLGMKAQKSEPVVSEEVASEPKEEPIVSEAPEEKETLLEDKEEKEETKGINNGLEAYADHKVNAKVLEEQYNVATKESDSYEEASLKSEVESYKADPDAYLLPDSDLYQVDVYQYAYWNKELCDLARNEIYARHGYIFEKEIYQQIFGAKNWYMPTIRDVNEIKLTNEEIYNVKCLKWWSEVEHNMAYETPDKGFTDCYQFGMNESFKVDLNGDGAFEEITFKGNQEDDTYDSVWLEINGTKSEVLEGFFEPYIWLVDMDKEDGYLELIIYDRGPSSDPIDYFYTYDKDKILAMGSVSGHLNDENYIKDKVLHAVRRSDILGTKYYSCNYELDEQHRLSEIYTKWIEVNVPLIVAEETNIYSKDDTASSHKVAKVGTTMTAIQTDLTDWVKIRQEDGSEGWVYSEDMHHFSGLLYCD